MYKHKLAAIRAAIMTAMIASAGALIPMNASAQDTVFTTDVIVQSSLCVGFDCVDGESFGFDTIRIKENNLRIKAEDTSNTASFPTVDWQITFNDSSNGGSDKFSIDDVTNGTTPFTIEANAPSDSLFVENSGQIGVGTSTPFQEIHVVDGDTPTLRLQQDGSSGFTPQVWDLAGNEANFFVRDVTGGSALPLRIRPGAPTSAIDIAGTGNVGLGAQSPVSQLHILETDAINATISLERTAGPGTARRWELINRAGDGHFAINNPLRAGAEFIFRGNGDLDIAGSLIAGPANDKFPDYVFDPEYDLMSLDALGQFIDENGHLPGVINQSDLDESGGKYDVTMLQVQLLEKVEQLTLYTLEQQATIDELKQRLGELEGSD